MLVLLTKENSCLCIIFLVLSALFSIFILITLSCVVSHSREVKNLAAMKNKSVQRNHR